MAQKHNQKKGQDLRYTVAVLGTASVSFVSNDYGFLYDLVRK